MPAVNAGVARCLQFSPFKKPCVYQKKPELSHVFEEGIVISDLTTLDCSRFVGEIPRIWGACEL
jgi:hypothetical protein